MALAFAEATWIASCSVLRSLLLQEVVTAGHLGGLVALEDERLIAPWRDDGTWSVIRCRNDALLVLLLPAAVGSFSFAAIQQAIKKPLSGQSGSP